MTFLKATLDSRQEEFRALIGELKLISTVLVPEEVSAGAGVGQV